MGEYCTSSLESSRLIHDAYRVLILACHICHTEDPVHSGHTLDLKSGCYREVVCMHRLNCTLQALFGLGNLTLIESWSANTVTIIHRFHSSVCNKSILVGLVHDSHLFVLEQHGCIS